MAEASEAPSAEDSSVEALLAEALHSVSLLSGLISLPAGPPPLRLPLRPQPPEETGVAQLLPLQPLLPLPRALLLPPLLLPLQAVEMPQQPLPPLLPLQALPPPLPLLPLPLQAKVAPEFKTPQQDHNPEIE